MSYKIACRWIILDWTKLFVVNLRATDNRYCLPWWKIENGETLENCIKREIKEELGIEAKIWNIAFIHEMLDIKDKYGIEFFYMIENIEDFKNIDTSKSTHGFEINKFERIDIFENNITILPKKLLWLLKTSTLEDLSQTRNIVSE